MNSPRLASSSNSPARLRWSLAILLTGFALPSADAQSLSFNKLVADTYHAPVNRGGSLRIVTDGLVDTVDSFRGFDTFNGNQGTPVFAGLIQTGLGAQPQIFDSATLSLGNQFVDGGDFLSAPELYMLINNVDTNTTQPGSDLTNWVKMTPGSYSHVGSDYTFTFFGTPAERTGYGFAIGGVTGTGSVRFLSVSELRATGTPSRLQIGSPINVVSSVYHSPDNNRPAVFTLATNGDVSPGGGFDNNRDWDTFEGTVGDVKTDFGGLLYDSLQQFDTLTLSYGTRFGDGGRFRVDAPPRLFLNITGVDTNTALPEADPINWREVTSATLIREPDGETFDLTNIPLDQRQGFGWAIGGVNGDGNNAANPRNFISISELSASGATVPEPSSALLLGGAALLLTRRRSVRTV